MSKKVIGIILVVILVITAILGFVVYNKNKKEDNKANIVEATNENKEVKNEENAIEADDEEEKETPDNKTLVVYFSAQTHTKRLLKKLQKN